MRRRRSLPGRLGRWLLRTAVRGIVWGGVLAGIWVAAYGVVNPPGGLYMLAERQRLGGIEHAWAGLDEISPWLVRSVVAAEDARFCDHGGFDFPAIAAAMRANRAGGPVHGASTLTQQVAKNVFLWHGRSWLRKGLEAGFTVLIEALWSKARIVEVYLNTAEFGTGLFGATAAARGHFGVPAGRLTADQAARLAVVLPNPASRDPKALGPRLSRRAGAVAAGARLLAASGRDGCVISGKFSN